MISDFGYILIFIVGSLAFFCVAMFTAYLIRPHRPNEEKETSYECGEDPIGNAWTNFNVRFYVIALIFILFDVEIVFMFPWALIFADTSLIEQTEGSWMWFALGEMVLFILILVVGLVYAWKRGFLDWEKPVVTQSDFKSKVPKKLYDDINKKYA
ncbi:NADH-quinone oxidoreductase subunit A [Chondrinema litorale]|uniref:NADH-quinone oxidoreductase subunit A n=1 Tax=Chondrinema litorale TaxID=2994555 RepID=UPI002542D041|nr:NADH-quinone oxidoreductase subunit A [Chondrinema litorale]UZR92434.1 NADH-quinone oxidoreductase subunit A [Chondrinema litorale]